MVEMELNGEAVRSEVVCKNSVVVIEVRMDLFHSWRPYKLILARLKEVHGVDRRYVCTGHSTCMKFIWIS